MNRNVLLLNSSEEIIKVIDWKKAIKLLESGKAKKPYAYNKTYSVRTIHGEYKLPAAIVLVRFVYLPYDDSMPSRRNVFKRDNWTCQYCGFISKNPKSLTIDHVYPKCMGGGTQWTNLVTACPKCNSKKGNKLLKECGMKLKNKPTKPKRLALQLVGLDESGKELWSRWVDLV
tara:strand:+ start:19 stop:537 length:519 start_codon:yes stop_codon:yes gene_type:complete